MKSYIKNSETALFIIGQFGDQHYAPSTIASAMTWSHTDSAHITITGRIVGDMEPLMSLAPGMEVHILTTECGPRSEYDESRLWVRIFNIRDVRKAIDNLMAMTPDREEPVTMEVEFNCRLEVKANR